MRQKDLVTYALATGQYKSIRELAKDVGVDHSTVLRWVTNERVMQFEEAAVLAEIAGLKTIETAAQIRIEHATGRRLKVLLGKLAKVAALLLFFLPHYTNVNCEEVHKYKNAQFDISRTDYTFTYKLSKTI